MWSIWSAPSADDYYQQFEERPPACELCGEDDCKGYNCPAVDAPTPPQVTPVPASVPHPPDPEDDIPF